LDEEVTIEWSSMRRFYFIFSLLKKLMRIAAIYLIFGLILERVLSMLGGG
jgi:hypothetical protein